MPLTERIFNAALAGLLIDIGKLEQRARPDPWARPEGSSADDEPIHAAWRNYFVEHSMPPVYQAAYTSQLTKSQGGDGSLRRLVALADALSSGGQVDLDESRKEIPGQLRSVFDLIRLSDDRSISSTNFLPLSAMGLQEQSLFPSGEKKTQESIRKGYQLLRDHVRQAAGIALENPETYLEHLLSTLQRYTWCVPSTSDFSAPAISVYDHSRMTAALAVCLAERPDEEVERMLEAVSTMPSTKVSQDEGELMQPAALLVGGDISGVQDFIYTITSRKAAKSLRGRSFYLQLLTEAVLRYTLRELGLPYTQVIYSGGGHFFLLVPVSLEKNLKEIHRQISERMLVAHGVDLYAALAVHPVPLGGFQPQAFNQHWQQMHTRLSQAKLQRYRELDRAGLEGIFLPPRYGGNPEQRCSVCGLDSEDAAVFLDDDETQQKICPQCQSYWEWIGTDLTRARYAALEFGHPGNPGGRDARSVFHSFGMSVGFPRDLSELEQPSGNTCRVFWSFGDPEEEPSDEVQRSLAPVYLRYTVNRVPESTFDELQKKCSGGFKRLGVLRMDVDDLGKVFSRGLVPGEQGGSGATLARTANLSLLMSLFFEGWVKHLVEDPAYGGWIYSVYAGGDDLFLLGPWDLMPDLAQRIRADFETYTGGNPDLHISGGLAFIHGKYPVYQAAEDAGDSLEAAKNLSGKDAFSFLGRAFKWPRFEEISTRKERLIQLIENGGSSSILQILQRLAEDRAAIEAQQGKLVWGPWIWRGAYLLSRMAERSPDSDTRQAIRALQSELDEDMYQTLPDWGTAARWAQLLLRKESGQDKKDRKESMQRESEA